MFSIVKSTLFGWKDDKVIMGNLRFLVFRKCEKKGMARGEKGGLGKGVTTSQN